MIDTPRSRHDLAGDATVPAPHQPKFTPTETMGKPKPFYRNPLIAAFMDLHHGVFIDDPFSVTAGLAVFLRTKKLPTIKLYIHPDSLHLLKPIVGDLVIHPWGVCRLPETQDQPAGRLRLEGSSACDIYAVEIIQRNGIAFHWPEFEK